jgi:hypothetical protein
MTTTRRPADLAAAVISLALALAGCTADDPAPDAAAPSSTDAPTAVAPTDGSDPALVVDPATLADADLDTLAALGAETLIASLEATPLDQRRTDLRASVRPDAVLLSDSTGAEVSVPVPEGKHYLSVAPYVTGTHDCFFHSLTTCTGELGGQQATVRIVDDETGDVYVDTTGPLEDNGFTGFWLPSGRTATVTVTVDGREGTATVRTGEEDLTCLTSLRVA